MHQGERENFLTNPRILLAPLDWGLGHGTRCILIIRELLKNNCDVWLAGNETQQALLKYEFPDLPFLFLRGYNIKYSKTGGKFFWKIFFQLPKIFFAARHENKWLKKIIKVHEFDAVISDNRFGLWSNKIPSVFITHQLTIKSSPGKWAEIFLQRFNYKYINRFSACWVPDVENEKNLAGELSHPSKKPKIPVHYIGPISRFEYSPQVFSNNKDHLLIILSGPEPQRTILENKIIDEIVHYPGTATIVRGLPAAQSHIPSTGMIKFHNHLPAEQLNEEIQKAGFVIGRCGYSTVMDLVKLKKKSILIPTPGQTEQEYLSKHLNKNKLAHCISQDDFSLDESLAKASEFDYHFFSIDQEVNLKTAVTNFLRHLAVK